MIIRETNLISKPGLQACSHKFPDLAILQHHSLLAKWAAVVKFSGLINENHIPFPHPPSPRQGGLRVSEPWAIFWCDLLFAWLVSSFGPRVILNLFFVASLI